MPRCKNPNCKDKFKPRIFLQKFCLEKGECIKMAVEQKKEKLLCEKVKEMKVDVYSKERRGDLQDAVNLLARKIDAKLGYACVDCGKFLNPEKNQIDACHCISRGKNSALKYHLHNLHSGHNHCNTRNPSHESNYKKGLVIRYGKEYLEMVESLPLTYKEIHLSNTDVIEKLAIVRKINRTFDTYLITSGDTARDLFNSIIGIYEK